jgi:hypothetical protein
VAHVRRLAASLAGRRHYGAYKAELGGFFKALLHMANGPDGPGQADLTETDGVLGRGPRAQGGEQHSGGSKVRGGLAELKAPATFR